MSFLANARTMLGGFVFAQIISIAAMPLLTRIYSPSEFGLFATFSGLMVSLLVISSLRYEFAIPLSQSSISARSLLILALLINVAISFLALVLILVLRHAISDYLSEPALANLLLLLPVVILGGGSYKALNYWAIRGSEFGLIAQTRIVQSLSNVGVQIATGFAGWGAYGLVLGQFFGLAAGTVQLARSARLRGQDFSDIALRRRMRGVARQHIRFPKFDVPASLVDVVSVQLPNILLAGLFTTSIAGFYLLAERVLSAPMSLVGQTIGQVLYAQSRDGARVGTLRRSAVRIVLVLAGLSIVPAIALFMIGETLFVVIFGEAWRQAGTFASWLIIGLCVQFIYSAISVTLMATEGQRLNLFIHSGMLVAKAIALTSGWLLGDPLVAIMAFSAVNFFGYLLAIFVVIGHVERYSASSNRNFPIQSG
ncbi:MAG: oligosaccharide flippase family protein [Rhizobiales bacterium]|nr:oligosaccharide flippase family protein [Hyphomicrobiales bacterium]